MSLDFSTELKEDYLLLRCHGTVTNDALLDVFEKAVHMASLEYCNALLVDVRGLKGVVPDTMQRHQFGVSVAELIRATGTQIALVGDESLIDLERAVETSPVNRGGNTRMFTDIEKADAWLRENVRE